MTTAQTTQNWKSIFRKFGWGYLCVLFSVALLFHSVSMWFNTRTTDAWLDPKFSTAQSHIPIPNRKFCKLYEHFSFFRKNHGLGIHSDKTWADTSTKNTLKYITTRPNHNLFGRSAQSAKIFGIGIWKKALIGFPLSVMWWISFFNCVCGHSLLRSLDWHSKKLRVDALMRQCSSAVTQVAAAWHDHTFGAQWSAANWIIFLKTKNYPTKHCFDLTSGDVIMKGQKSDQLFSFMKASQF